MDLAVTGIGGKESPDIDNLIPRNVYQRGHEKFPNIKNIDYIEGAQVKHVAVHDNGEDQKSS